MGCYRYFVVLVFLMSQFILLSQDNTDPTEWWHYDQDYYQFTVAEDGIYKITYQDLLEMGFPIAGTDGDKIRLYSMGKEVRLFVSNKGSFSERDYILFYGRRNDGAQDAALYKAPAESQLNPAYSLFTDERSYFLTLSDTISTERFRSVDNGIGSGGLPPKESYFIHHEFKVFYEFHHKPYHNGRDFLRYSHMDEGEGFGSKLAHRSDIHIPLHDPSEFGIDPVLELRFGTNVHSRSWQIRVNDQLIKNINQPGYGTVTVKERLPRDLLTGDHLTLSIVSLGLPEEKHTVAYYDLSYPRLYNRVKGFASEFSQQASIISRLVEIPVDSMKDVLLFNLDKGTVTTPVADGGSLKFVSPPSFSEDHFIAIDRDKGAKSIRNFNKYQFTDLFKDNEYLILTHKNLKEGAESYARYRASEAGGGFKSGIVYVGDLYNHYTYGTTGHPAAIHLFIDDLRRKGQTPEYIFIIGKGVEYADSRQKRLSVSSLVPTYGVPGSDNLLLARMDSDIPEMSIGRLSARTSQEVIQYLEKIWAHENSSLTEQTIEDQKWKKNIIHFSGGSSDIQNLLYNYLKNMGGLMQNKAFGSHLTTFRKTTSDPIESANSDQIIKTINDGAAILSFFGHSAVGSFDFSLENPSKYSNKEKNPVIISLGCHSGNIHTVTRGISEDFVLEPEHGATHFLASSSTAYINPQYFLGMDLYDLIGEDMYGQAIGKVINRALKMRADKDDISIKTLVQQLTLHGDPAYRLPSFEGPDYAIDYTSVAISPGIINSTNKSFQLTFDVVNLGKNVNQVLDIMLIHEYGEGPSRDTSYLTIPGPSATEQVVIELNNPGKLAIGSNKIYIVLDHNNKVEEWPTEKAKSNNALINDRGEKGYTFYVLDNTASPVYPADFGIVNTDDVELEAALNNAFDFSGQFIIQIDTTELFNSPLFEEKVIRPVSSRLKYRPQLPLVHNTVYYWRIAPVDVFQKESAWRGRSFIYLRDSPPGWNQSHYYQWKNNLFNKLAIRESDRKFSFAERTWDIRIKNKMKDPNDFWVFVNNSPWKSLNPKDLAPGIQIFAWHPEQVIVSNPGNSFGSIPFSPDGFVFRTQTREQRRGIRQLLDALPDGSRVFLHTLIENTTTTLNISDWDKDRSVLGYSLFDVLESYGSKRVGELRSKGAVPFTMIFDKGKGLVIEDAAASIEGTVDLSSKGISVWNEGTLNSTVIGPAQEWQKLLWAEAREASDATILRLYGVNRSGKKELISDYTGTYDIDLSSIDATLFPYLSLEYLVSDPKRTAPQLSHWRILNTNLSDAILYSSQERPFALEDTINSGDDLDLSFDIINNGTGAFDPILIRYTLTDAKQKQSIFVSRSTNIPANSTVRINKKIKTQNLGGRYTITVEINPGREQAEWTYANNIGVAQIYIRPDKRNPFLQLKLDGRPAKNGQKTDTSPIIDISLWDPGAYVLLNRPEDFEIKLYYPEIFVRNITLTDPDVRFLPAESLDHNVARFILTPNLTAKGTYTLEVQAKDPSGNQAGPFKHQVRFVVDQEEDPTRLTISPNPFSRSVTFDYNLIGIQIPEIFYMRIFASDGRMVRYVDRYEWGGLYFGINQYIWDGRDESGNELPDGVYYYEIVNSNDNSSDKIRGSIIKTR